ncbi:MAG: 2-oxoacid:acceptor oxidoreductase family protein, partial [Chitinophagales bacterium]|nr:2-oxoacid:acceptor oxidoreductase family protein [Chitinophagales bacterium]
MVVETLPRVVIKFAGDSGDGMQLAGNEFATDTVLYGNDIATYPDFPAEIRAPQGTIPGVSGFQLHLGSSEIDSPGDNYDVLVAMNAAALKVNLKHLKKGGLIIADSAGFEAKNLKLAGFDAQSNPLESDLVKEYRVQVIDISRLTKEALKHTGLDGKIIDRCKNMFVLGYILWIFNRSTANVEKDIHRLFSARPQIRDANLIALKTGYNFGETTEVAVSKIDVPP